jgi:GTPase Era involved in 16S rRNA processing
VQVLLFDTPGLVEVAAQGSPLCRLRSAWATAAAADLLLLIVDAERQARGGRGRRTAGRRGARARLARACTART